MKQVIINCPTFKNWQKLEGNFPFAPIDYKSSNAVRVCLEWLGDDNNSAEYLRDVVLISDAIKYFKVDAKDFF